MSEPTSMLEPPLRESATVSLEPEGHSIPSASPVPSPPLLTCKVFSDFASIDSLRESWDALAVASGSPVYLSFDWVKVWWDHYGNGRPLRIYLFYSGVELVAAVPAFTDTLGFGPWRVKVARIVGAGIPPRLLHPPLRPDCAADVFEQIARNLFIDEDCDCANFGPISASWQSGASVIGRLKELNRLVAHCQITSAGVHSVFSLPKTYEEYLSGLSKNERKNRRKYELRMMAKEFDTSLEVLSTPGETAAEFERFMIQHAEQWRAEGKPGHFGSWPRGAAFNRDLVATQGKLGRMRFVRIIANGQVVSNQYTFAFGDTWYWELPARSVAPEWEKFSLGATGLTTLFQKAIEEGVSSVEGGIGHYDYKVRLNAEEVSVNAVRIVRQNKLSIQRVALLRWFLPAVNFLYNKVWYRRILRKLPLKLQRPHSAYWLRFDF